MRKALNLVLELGQTNIPAIPCTLPCTDRHYLIVRPKDYDKRKKVLKHGARFTGFTLKGDIDKSIEKAVIEEAKRYEFND